MLFPQHTTSQFQLPDGRTESISHSQSVTCGDILKLLCEKLQITNAYNFNIQSAAINRQERWLLPEISLIEQGVGSRDKLFFRNQFPLSPSLTLQSCGSVAVHYTYCQV